MKLLIQNDFLILEIKCYYFKLANHKFKQRALANFLGYFWLNYYNISDVLIWATLRCPIMNFMNILTIIFAKQPVS